jgi:DNA processing protein
MNQFAPSNPDERMDYLRLALVAGVGPKLLAALQERFDCPREVLQATLSQLGQTPRVGPKLASAIREASRSDLADRVVQHCQENQVRIVLPLDPDFPKLLSELADPPPLLFVRGDFDQADQMAIGIVGTRHPTHYGSQMADTLARGLSQAGLTIVSGLARGIDSVAHRAALQAGGRTIAMLGSSVTEIYPPEHDELAGQISSQGALVSETHPFAKPKAGVFPQRNRLISGISLGVIVVEAAERSGALITAQHAGEQGRDLFAVPGPITSRVSRGTNRLIRDGAILIQDAQDVIEHLGPMVSAVRVSSDRVVHHPSELMLNDQEQTVLQAIPNMATSVDKVIVQSQLPVPRVLSTLSVLEMRGLIQRCAGNCVIRR